MMYKLLKSLIVLVLWVLTIFSLGAENVKSTWNLGTIDTVWNHSTKIDNDSSSIDKFSVSLLDFQFQTLINNLGYQISLVNIKHNYDKDVVTLFPIEVYYDFLQNKIFRFGAYSKGELGLNEVGIVPFFELGIKVGTYYKNNPSRFRYSWKNSIYIGFDSNLEFNIGTQVDIGSLGLLLLFATSNIEG
ncbi:hypothetical protein EW093_07770 [Thiospirochaeta perfilievii]|uniref:Uncharacterized protein n=1 Tax=Thiospirochaeta perfilievii TaxID=252967 RepID=A0A5C1QD13_9SPIO|nr:hypothetical protein [Thiospirochaeta perfilievii]QEN04604.1 hypothetical protein EW093_07770 [Thiospirochaeta perfilievii]